MEHFYVINYNCNTQKFERYDVIPYLAEYYNSLKNDKVLKKWYPAPETFDEFKDFVIRESMYKWWGRCEYEIILLDWPCKKVEEKWDIYEQIMMNLDIVTKLLMISVNAHKHIN